jgi:hypothetical protein
MVVDSVGVALEGESESARDVIEFHKDMNRFRAEGVAVLLIDHQSKLQHGQAYKAMTTFGSVYKGILARSVVQVEPFQPVNDQEADTLTVSLRQTKDNFGSMCAPFGAKLTFADRRVTVETVELDPDDSSTEKGLTARGKVILALSPSRRIHTPSIAFPAGKPEQASDLCILCRKKDQWLTV